MKVLISRPDKIGDVVLALHCAKELKKRLPHFSVYMHVADYTAALVKNVSFLDGVVTIGEDLQQYEFDAVVDLMAKSKAAFEYARAGIPLRIGNVARWFTLLYNKRAYIRRSKALMNESEYNWKLVSLLDPSLKNSRLEENVVASDFKGITPFTESSQYYLLFPGITVSAKGLGKERWVALAEKFASKDIRDVLILLGPAEAKDATFYEERFAENARVKVRCVSDYAVLLGIVQGAYAFIGPSTGITHIASVFKVPGVALYPEMRSMHPRRWQPFTSSLQVISIDRNPDNEQLVNAVDGEVFDKLNPLAREKVSAFVICCNEEKNIERCLSSLRWCDEIVVVDSGSEDSTVSLAKKFTSNVIFNPWGGHRQQKQFALEKCAHNWIVNIDSDEEVSTELRSQIEKVLSQPAPIRDAVHGYFICRTVYFLERWWDKGGWFPEYRMRFFQRKHTRWGGVNPHEKALVEGKLKRLPGEIYHYTYTGIRDQIDALGKHAANSAQHLYADGKRCHLLNLIFNPIFRVFKFYFLKRGFREGKAGLVVAGIEGCYTFFKYSSLWELQRQEVIQEQREVSSTKKAA